MGPSQELGGGGGSGLGDGSLLATLGTGATVTAIGCLVVKMLSALPRTPTRIPVL